MQVLYERFGRQAFGLAYRILGDGSAAQNVVQEAFLMFWREAERIGPARAKIGSFLLTMVHYKAMDALRAGRGGSARQPTTADIEDLERTDSEVLAGLLDRKHVQEEKASVVIGATHVPLPAAGTFGAPIGQEDEGDLEGAWFEAQLRGIFREANLSRPDRIRAERLIVDVARSICRSVHLRGGSETPAEHR